VAPGVIGNVAKRHVSFLLPWGATPPSGLKSGWLKPKLFAHVPAFPHTQKHTIVPRNSKQPKRPRGPRNDREHDMFKLKPQGQRLLAA
jgi:hypothetical protein